jgi:hypothetical protein
LVLPEVGITGNSHVFVVEKNNLQIAELITSVPTSLSEAGVIG